jgi:hypothetical protein
LRDQKIGLAAYRAATARDEIYGGPDHCDRVGNDWVYAVGWAVLKLI